MLRPSRRQTPAGAPGSTASANIADCRAVRGDRSLEALTCHDRALVDRSAKGIATIILSRSLGVMPTRPATNETTAASLIVQALTFAKRQGLKSSKSHSTDSGDLAAEAFQITRREPEVHRVSITRVEPRTSRSWSAPRPPAKGVRVPRFESLSLRGLEHPCAPHEAWRTRRRIVHRSRHLQRRECPPVLTNRRRSATVSRTGS
jgi:hypothetical protein